jgi:cellulose synthase/poly-beta-1,6-N-acetylglucosamine synthase-like glycosyltransferase
MSGFLAALSVVVFSINVYFVFWVYRGLRTVGLQGPSSNPALQSLSIIIAARNEASNIQNCLRALADQEYPKDRYEIIVVADRCSDETVQIAGQFKDEFANFKILEIRDVPKGISPKKHALAKGIEMAAFDQFIFLDADVIPNPNHVKVINQYFDGEAVVGIMKLNLEHRFWHSFLKYERLLNWSVAAAGIANGSPVISYGGNWGYTRKAFEMVNGFEGISKSLGGDDDLLLQKFGRENLNIRFCTNPDGWVLTQTPDSLAKFLMQRRRHLAAGKYYQSKYKIAYFLYHSSNLLIWILPFLYLPILILLLLKILCNAALLNKSLKIFREKLSIVYTPIFEILFVLYNVFVGMWGLLGRIKW